jgi:hypothetical protein
MTLEQQALATSAAPDPLLKQMVYGHSQLYGTNGER